MKSNYRNLLWGLFLIFITVYLVGWKLGLIKNIGLLAGASLFDIILGIIFLVFLIKGIAKISFTQIFFSLAVLGIIFDKQLHIEKITPWIILLAALLLSIAMNLIFSGIKKESFYNYVKKSANTKKQYTYTDSEQIPDADKLFGNGVCCKNSFGEFTKYITSDNFVHGEFTCQFGELNIYLTDAIIQGNSASIDVYLRFGELTLFIPKQWRTDCQANRLFAGINIQGAGNRNPDAKILIINGNVSFGELKIIYI